MARTPTLTVTCDCGTLADVPLGYVWMCDCGREWSAADLPASHAHAIADLRRRLRRQRLVTLLALVALCSLPAIVLDRGAALVAVPAAFILWATVVRPALRRSYARAVSDLPAFEIEAQSVPAPAPRPASAH
jgi:hypothetical protein